MAETDNRMLDLARSFPSLRRKLRAAESFDAMSLWEAAQPWSHGEKCAAAFVLSVYNPKGEWSLPEGHEDRFPDSPAPLPFDFHDAYGVWDDEPRQAFVKWAQAPWWP